MTVFVDSTTKFWVMLVAAGLLTGLAWWRPMLGLAVYCASVGLDYLLRMVGFSTQGLFSIGQGMLVVLVFVAVLRWYAQRRPMSPAVRGLFLRTAFFAVTLWLSVLCAISPSTGVYY